MRFDPTCVLTVIACIVNLVIASTGISKATLSTGLLSELNRLRPGKRSSALSNINEKRKRSTNRKLRYGQQLDESDISNLSSENLIILGSEITKNGAGRGSKFRIQELLNSYSNTSPTIATSTQSVPTTKLPSNSNRNGLLSMFGGKKFAGLPNIANGFGGFGSITGALGRGSNPITGSIGKNNLSNPFSTIFQNVDFNDIAKSLGLSNLGKNDNGGINAGGDDLIDDWGEDDLGDDWGDDFGDDDEWL